MSPVSFDIIASSLDSLARGNEEDISAFLTTVESHGDVADTNARSHCHFVTLDGNGKPRTKYLIEYICRHVLDYAIPRSDIEKAKDEIEKHGSTAPFLKLQAQAKKLFTSLKKSGEGGELLLFVLAEQLLNLPQLLCKMDLKTNAEMHFHGADGLHVGVDESSGKVALYWGESKIYASISSGLSECFNSVAAFLKGDGGTDGSEQRDIQLLNRHLDLSFPELEEALKNYLNPDSPNFNSLEFRGLCLVGFDYDKYPNTPNSITQEELAAEVALSLEAWKEKVQSNASKAGIESYFIHVFCLPIPSAEKFRDQFFEELGISNES